MRVQMRAEIKALHQRLRTTTLYVTHDQVEAMTMADIVVVMHAGRVEQIGAPLALYDEPANLFVAQFIGSPAMNVLRGTWTADGGSSRLVTPEGIVLPVDGGGPPVEAGTPLAVGFRPEHLELHDTGLDAEVVVVEPTGSETQVLMRCRGTELVAVFRERFKSRPGETVRVRPATDHLHYFETSQGRRLAAAG